MNWGKGIALTLIAFASMMTYFMVLAVREPEPLITEHYYEQELVYQDRIDATSRANALGGVVIITGDRSGISVAFPDSIRGSTISGQLHLLRLNDPAADRDISINGAVDSHFAQAIKLLPGKYLAQLAWSVGGVDYFTQEDLHVE